MKRKAFISGVLAAAMAAGLAAGCGNQEGSAGTEASAAETAAAGQTEAAGAGSEAGSESSGAAAVNDGEIVTITAKLLNNTVSAEGAARVIERLNELTESKIGVHVDVEFIEFGSWNQTINLMISGSEAVDVISLSPMLTIDMLEKQNALMDITDLLDEYAPETVELMDKLLPSTSKNGRIYGVPKLSDMDLVRGFFMREDILEEMGMLEEAQNIQSWSELEELLLAVKEAYPDMTPLYVSYNNGSTPSGAGDDCESDVFADNSNLDTLGDSYKFVYVDPETGSIESLYESDMYTAMIERISRWYQEGLVYTDGAVTQDDTTTAMSGGNVFCYFGQGKSDPEVAALEIEGMTEQELIFLPLFHTATLTSNVNIFGFAVPYTSKEPEAAVQFINLMMTDPEVTNLLSYGEEGVDYVVEDGVAKYPEGVDANSVGYHSQSFLFGNELQAYPWDGSTPENQENAMDFYMNRMEIPEYFGFVADTDAITNEITACYNATLEYRPTLECGSAEDWEQSLADFRQKLKDCGIDKIIEAYREQGAAFLESK